MMLWCPEDEVHAKYFYFILYIFLLTSKILCDAWLAQSVERQSHTKVSEGPGFEPLIAQQPFLLFVIFCLSIHTRNIAVGR